MYKKEKEKEKKKKKENIWEQWLACTCITRLHIWAESVLGHLPIPCWLAGEEFPFSLPKSLSSISLPSKQTKLFLILGSELALLLVARGESAALTVLIVEPDLTL
jgi:hypothetical protein